ncbi:MAG: hypothetical protein HY897_06480 [Deltaproteobacteria bacterium]|nr:hypothetical protein [Deltaproteobacteria bacterium]
MNWLFDVDPDYREITLSSPPVIDAAGTVYVGYSVGNSTNVDLRAINADGTLKWLYFVHVPMPLGVAIFAPSIGYCNRMYFVANLTTVGMGNVLYALGEDMDGGVEDCSYPEVGYDDAGYGDTAGSDEGVADGGAWTDTGVRDARYSTDSAAEVVISAPGCGCAQVGW